ncbi:MAG: thiamine diphosphokinase [Paracoccaceae bacterium]
MNSDRPVTLIGGGVATPDDLEAARGHAPDIVAADSGAALALRCGIVPRAVIGDFDSLAPELRAQIPDDRLHPIAEQDSTDFDKALRSIEAPLVLGIGFLGDRVDHLLACQSSLVRRPDRRCLLIGRMDVLFLCPPALDLPLAPGTRVSLFPMGAVEGWSDGLTWPIQGLNFAPDGVVGTSNRALGSVRLELAAPRMLVILPRECLGLAVRALADAAPRWPAP